MGGGVEKEGRRRRRIRESKKPEERETDHTVTEQKFLFVDATWKKCGNHSLKWKSLKQWRIYIYIYVVHVYKNIKIFSSNR